MNLDQLKYIRAVDIQPGDTIAFSIKTEKDKYSKVKYMVVDETVEDEFESGEAAVACHGRIYMQPQLPPEGERKLAMTYKDVQLSTIKKQKLHIKTEPTILLLARETMTEAEEAVDITALIPLYPPGKEEG